MSASLLITDESLLNPATAYQLTVNLTDTKISLRELIRLRVYQEVTQYNTNAHATRFHGLIQPTEQEKQLNGEKQAKFHALDWQKHYTLAIEAFQHNGFIVLVNRQQINDLDAFIDIYPDTQVSFLKLIPLIGG